MSTSHSQFDQAEFAAAMERIAEGTSPADVPMRPPFDWRQHLDVVDECRHGRKVDDYKQALERAGFVRWPAGSIPPGCQSRGSFDPPRPLMEAQWRRPADRNLPNLAITDDQVVSWFSSPEEFWQWLMKMRDQAKTRAAEADRTRPIKIFVPR